MTDVTDTGDLKDWGCEDDIEALDWGAKEFAPLVAVGEMMEEKHIFLVESEKGVHIFENVFEDMGALKRMFSAAAFVVTAEIEKAEGYDAAAAYLAMLVADCL